MLILKAFKFELMPNVQIFQNSNARAKKTVFAFRKAANWNNKIIVSIYQKLVGCDIAIAELFQAA